MEDAVADKLTRLAPDPARPVLIAGPTASGKSALALEIAERQGGVIVNADAIQVFSDWRVLTARPSEAEESRAPHRLYGHVPGDCAYSVGAWLRDLAPLLAGPDRPIIVGGTGLYFSALTEGLAEIPATPPEIRAAAMARLAAGEQAAMAVELDPETRGRIDLANPMRVQRAWEVLQATGRGIAAWQADTPPPLLPLAQAQPILFDAPKDWLNARIERRFRQMVAAGALEEARANLPGWSPALPSAKAIGAAELMAHLRGEIALDEAIARATVLTRQFAKRQRSWFRARMKSWPVLAPAEAGT
ncbi:tRNA (adenosine(37)-N6)-dimethylallyltransferase MiaA [Salipiger sp. P9]|uniref:tRNA (adenosine(37)-N6)-dimethylallyltransferase MiaA n=1 Tax=Salipiger pentaromativorans TaxID=2943193 RepID=UPI002157E9F6|nr:tRNA (adenosine(37)-N6)-dimethylallyltransferase MiaA [Salipiger pentaromativorans]MCR8547315.1 tRNA (adenosine(37)-N6)-dimethylallyltransferase MiaA [Salipiger pentaromativorans]